LAETLAPLLLGIGIDKRWGHILKKKSILLEPTVVYGGCKLATDVT
jgi:hypothetical protein